MPGYLSVAVREQGRATVVHVDGELDLASARALEAAIREARRASAPMMVVDLEKLRFIDMSGLRVLIKAREQAEGEGRRLVLANARGPVRRVLALARLEELFPEV